MALSAKRKIAGGKLGSRQSHNELTIYLIYGGDGQPVANLKDCTILYNMRPSHDDETINKISFRPPTFLKKEGIVLAL